MRMEVCMLDKQLFAAHPPGTFIDSHKVFFSGERSAALGQFFLRSPDSCSRTSLLS
jgi:hypothetical protein